MKSIFFYSVLAIFFVLSCSFQTGQETWTITGLKPEYNVCDSISFTIKKAVDTCKTFIIVAIERKHDDKWVRFDENILLQDKTLKVSPGYYFDNVNSYNNSVNSSWHPCKLKAYADIEFRSYFKGQFRVVFVGQCNDTGYYHSIFYSQPFEIK